jgi:hypothetical protein
MLAADAVTTDKIFNETILSEDILDGTIAVADIGTGAVGSDEIIDNSIEAIDINTSAVTSDEILNLTILTEDIADNAITNVKMADDAITTTEIFNETILSEDIFNGTIATIDIADNAVNATKLNVADDGTVSQVLTSDGDGSFSWTDQSAIDPDMALGDLNNVGFDTETDGNILIADGTSWESQTMAGDVTIDNSGATTIGALKVTNGMLAADAVTTDKIFNETILSEDILDGTIVNADISATAGIVDTKLATISTAGKVSNTATTATSANTVDAIVLRDGSGDFSANEITADLIGDVTGDITGNAATVTTNANLTGPITSVGNATSVASQTGTGSTFVMNTSPTLVTPELGVATATSLTATGDLSGDQLISTIVDGTAPLVVTSTTPVANLSIGGNAATATLASTVTTNANLTGDVTSVGNATTISNDAVTSAMINNGEIVNADISATAAIVDTKLATISTAGKVSNTATTATSANTVDAIVLRDGSGDFSANEITADLIGDVTGDITGNAATVSTNANLTGPITSVGNATSVAAQTGTGSTFVMNTSPTLVTPEIGVATATSLTATGDLSGDQLISTIADGTAPLVVTSTTPVANLSIGGNAATATLATTVTTNANLTGDVTSVGNATTISNDAVTSAMINNGEIVNADISATAAIVDTKLATISTAGKVSNTATTATSANTVDAIVLRDGSGDFSANEITADLIGDVTGDITGNAATVTTNANLTGDVTSVGNATTIANDAVTSAMINNGEIVNADISATAGIVDTKLATISTAGKVSNTATTATSANTVDAIVLRDGSGDFSANEITADLIGDVTGDITGNAATVTTNANLTGPITSVGNATSVALQTGTGSTFVMNTSPTLVTPEIGVATATSLTATGDLSGDQLISTIADGTAPLVVTSTTPVANLSIGGNAATATLASTVTTNANLTGPITSVGNATSVALQTGTGSTFVMNTSPTLVTPEIGVATATSLTATGDLSGDQLISTIADGTAPLVVTSTTPVANLSIGGNAATATLASTVTTNANLTGDVTSVGNATTIANDAVTSAMINNGEIVNADISATAAIVDTKLATISTAGKVSNTATTATSANTVDAIVLRDGSGDFSANEITADLIGDVTGDITGNAATVTTNANLTGDVTSVGNATTIANDAVTSAMINNGEIVNADISATAGIVDTKLATISTAGKVSNTATTATSANTVDAIVLRDGSGDFSANEITADLIGDVTGDITGNAATVTTNANLTGDVTSVGNATTIANDAVTSAMINNGEIVNADISATAAIVDTKLATISTAGKVSNTATTATSANTVDAIVRRDASGDFIANEITADLLGNATTATTATSFSGNLAGDVTGPQGTTVVASVGGSTAANVNAATVLANAATDANTFSAIVRRDASGDFIANEITADLVGDVTGNATTATSASNLSGTPALPDGTTATTQGAGDNSTQLATTEYVDSKVTDAIADAETNLAPTQNAVFDALALKAPLASPTFTGTVTIPTVDINSGTIDNTIIGATTAVAGSFTNLSATGTVSLSNDAIQTAEIQDDQVTVAKITDAAADQILTTDGSGNPVWDAKANYTATLADADIFIGNAANNATGRTMSGDATISRTGALTIGNNAITSAKINDGTILNADVNASAAIAGTKISPDFGTQNVTTSGSILSSGTGGIGYATGAGAGGTVSQLTSKSTAVTINKISGQITTDNEWIDSGTIRTFQVNNSVVSNTDVIIINLAGGTSDYYELYVSEVGSSYFKITLINYSGGWLNESLNINFAVIKATQN